MRPQDWIWEFFYENGTKYLHDKSHKNAWCLAELEIRITSLRDAEKAAYYNGEIKDAICGKIDVLVDHLLKCQHVTPEVKSKVVKYQEMRQEAKNLTNMAKQRHNLQSATVAQMGTGSTAPNPDRTQTWKLSEAEQEEFTRDICDVFVACGFAWNALSNPILKRFTNRWIPHALLPNRQTVSERVLLERVAEVEAQDKQLTVGKLAMGQCDGWKNIARNPVIAMLMSVEGKTHILGVHHVGAARKTAENLLTLIKLNMTEAKQNYGVEWIGWCTDAGGDSRKARKLLFEEMPELICPDCWAHQINLVVGDYFRIKVDFITAAVKAQKIIKWFNQHSRALEWLHEEQLHSLQKILALIYPVLTRWTSIYMALRRLIDCLPAFRGLLNNHDRIELRDLAGTDKKARAKAVEIMDTIADEQFWRDITRISIHLEPLTIAAHVTQGSSTRLDQVLLTLGNLYRIFSTMSGDDLVIRQAVCTSLERRWAATDQDIFIMAVFFNPYIRADLFNKQSGEFLCAGIIALVIRVWKRLFHQSGDPDFQFVRACSDYYQRSKSSIFSDVAMNLALLERIAHSEEQEVDIVSIWEQIDDLTFQGRNWLVKLAIRVLSVVANSAGCERLFSQMGIVHTKYRSRLELQRVRDTVVLRTALMRDFDVGKSTGHRRLKRKVRGFDSEHDSNCVGVAITERESEPVLEDTGFSAALEHEQEYDDAHDLDPEVSDDFEAFFASLTRRLIEDVRADTEAAAELEGSRDKNSAGPSQNNSFGRPFSTTLSTMFDFSVVSSSPAESQLPFAPEAQPIRPKNLGMYWRGALRSVTAELERLELLQSDDLLSS